MIPRRRRHGRRTRRLHRDRDVISIDLWPHHPPADSPLRYLRYVWIDPHVDLLSLDYEPPSVEDEPKHRARYRCHPDPGPVHGLRGNRTLDAMSTHP